MRLWLLITLAPQVAATGTGPVDGLTDRPAVPEDSKLALLEENTSNVLQGTWGYWFYQSQTPSGSVCQAYKNYVNGKNYQSVGKISIWTNLVGKVTCSDKNAVQNLMYNWQRMNSRYSVNCNGRTWRVGPCGGWQEICAGCSSICQCNSGISIRPCIGNYNWGGSGTTCSAAQQVLYMDLQAGSSMKYSYTVQQGQSCTRGQCNAWKAQLNQVPVNSGGPLTLHSSYNGAKYTCNDNNAVNNIIANLKVNGRYNVVCNGQWWRTGPCNGPEICVGCNSICQCNGPLTYRPCIVNSNFGGAGTTCSPPTQTLTMTVGSGKPTTTTTSTSTTTTTTTTTKVRVLMKTFMLPEFSSWAIKDGKGKAVCKGSGYSNWYETVKVDCKLKFQKSYRVTCMNSKVGGWAGGYLQVKNKKLCLGYKWSQGKSWSETFTAR